MNARYLVVPYLRDSNPRVRRAALIALDQMDGGKLTRELVTPLLDTDDPALQKTTLAIIAKHDGWAKQTLTLPKKWLQTPKLDANRAAIVRGFLIAQSADKSVQKLVGESFLSHGGDTDTAKRLLLLDVMQRSSVTPFPAAWKHALRRALPAKQSAVTLQAVRIVRDRELNFDDLLKPITENARQPVELRAEALAARAPRMKTVDDATVRFLSGELTREHPPLTRLTIAHTLAVSPLNDKQLIELCKTLALAGPLEAPVLLRAFAGSESEKVGAALVASLNRSKSARGLSPDELNRLLQNYPPSVQRQAQPLLKRLGVNPAKQRRQIAALLKLAAGGSAERGRKIFYGKRAACAGCHTVSGKGGRVGPDLTGIGRIRQPRDLVEAIAFPSASFARGFRSYIIATDRGKIHTGVITRQTTSSITLRTATLAEVRIPRKEIDVIKESTTSIMPKGLDKTLSAAELRDLLAFLRSLRSRETAAR
ncbi:MAG: c-type cytochrome [Planctomycetaceae bacterium]